jgi:RNA polymerase sigma-70 factor, ECF subfamily
LPRHVQDTQGKAYSFERIVRNWPCLYTCKQQNPVAESHSGDFVAMHQQPQTSEATLIARARAGNSQAFGELANRHAGQVYRMSFKILKNHEDAEDNTQNVLYKAFGKIRQFEGKSMFSTWLGRIAINEALMMLRKQRTEIISQDTDGKDENGALQMSLAIKDVRPDPERAYIMRELAEKAFEELNPTLTSTFILNKREGWTNRELSKILGITGETVKSRIFRARVRLRQRLESLANPESVALTN